MARAGFMERETLATEARYTPVTAERRVRDDLEVSFPKPCKLSDFFSYCMSFLVFLHTKMNSNHIIIFIFFLGIAIFER
jgi:hypothetical protein